MTERVLTPREWEVFDLIVWEGLDNQEISESLGISVRSAKFHVGNVLRKMGTPDRLKLTVTYWRSRVEGDNPRGMKKGARKLGKAVAARGNPVGSLSRVRKPTRTKSLKARRRN
jgi:DNA-binding CsgD family transcriptional regulator